MNVNRWKEMLVFAQVVQSGSFSAAARQLDLTPSAVAKLIARLEQRVAIRLLNRTTRQLHPTPEGRLFHESCLKLLADMEEAENRIAPQNDAPRGHLRVNASLSFGHHVLIPALPAFFKCYPEVTIDLTLTDTLIDLLEERTDIAIRHGVLKDSRLVARKLGDSRHLLVASPAYLARHGIPQTPADLVRHNCLDFNFSHSLSEWRFRLPDGSQQSVAVRGNLQANNGETLLQMALANIGISRMSYFHVAETLRAGRLVEILAGCHVADSKPLHAIYHSRCHIPARIRLFVDFLAEQLHGKL